MIMEDDEIHEDWEGLNDSLDWLDEGLTCPVCLSTDTENAPPESTHCFICNTCNHEFD